MMMNIKTWRDLTSVTTEIVASATYEEILNLYRRIVGTVGNSPKDKAMYGMWEEDWMNKEIERVYWLLSNEMDRKYKEENEDKVVAYFNEHFKGKTWEEIKNDEELYECWSFYSDYHKDVYGYRPHAIVCGEYVSPY